ncbi:hypothetical protein [Streptomyces sp. NPDC053431]|uniref:hypothetical protein n=1 Tax=Streptomyces sp. NPDC053431 TaxID=3365703 RepID=UPI0037D6FD71
MKKRSMLAIASLAAGVVTALVTPTPNASAAEPGEAGPGVTGLLQEDQSVGSLVGETAEDAGTLPISEVGGLL